MQTQPSTQEAVQAFVRQQNIRVLRRALKAEADPDDRLILRRLLREQERMQATALARTSPHFPREADRIPR
jgi:hypothetical protein